MALPEPKPGLVVRYDYGFIPPGLFAQIKTKFLELARQGRARRVRR